LVDVKINKDNRNKTRKNHSAEHLLEKIMNQYIDSSIKQMGAFKSPDRLTFDFQYPSKLTDDKIKLIEEKINDIIKQDIKVNTVLTTIDEAHKSGAVAHFDNVYSKIKGKLRLVCFPGVVNEICGGTHVNNLQDIEEFMIVNLTTKGSGM
jgi:alanyl-tRNA synthetase